MVATHLGSSIAAVRRRALPRRHARSPPSARWHAFVLPQILAGNCGKRAGSAADLMMAVFCAFWRNSFGSLAWRRLSRPVPCFGDARAVDCTVRSSRGLTCALSRLPPPSLGRAEALRSSGRLAYFRDTEQYPPTQRRWEYALRHVPSLQRPRLPFGALMGPRVAYSGWGDVLGLSLRFLFG